VATEHLPLFPLHTVLFPGGVLGLRVFEPRYLDMVRECGRAGHGFGVCLILQGEEVGAAASSAAVGCEARIEDFSASADGLLQLTVRGARRFHVERSRVRDNGLVVGVVRGRADPVPAPLQPEFELLSLLLRRMVDRAGPANRLAATETDFRDAAWVGWRLAVWLPLDGDERQQLLQEDAPERRLQRLLEWIPRFQAA
jgi:Lon protease-like protein